MVLPRFVENLQRLNSWHLLESQISEDFKKNIFRATENSPVLKPDRTDIIEILMKEKVAAANRRKKKINTTRVEAPGQVITEDNEYGLGRRKNVKRTIANGTSKSNGNSYGRPVGSSSSLEKKLSNRVRLPSLGRPN